MKGTTRGLFFSAQERFAASAEYYRELESKGITIRLPPLDQGGH